MSLELENKDISKTDELDNLIKDLNTVDRSILAAFIKEKMPKRNDCTASATVIMNDNLIADGPTDEEVGCDPIAVAQPTKDLAELMTSTIFDTVSEMDKLSKLIKKFHNTFPKFLNKDEEVLLVEIDKFLKEKVLPMDGESDFKPSFDSNGIKSALADLEKAEGSFAEQKEQKFKEKARPPFRPVSGVVPPKKDPFTTKVPSTEIDWDYIKSRLKSNDDIKNKSIEELEVEYIGLHALIRKSKYRVKLLKLAIHSKQEDEIFKLEDALLKMQGSNLVKDSCHGR